MDDELRNRKARMNRVLTPLCGFIAAVALIGLVLVVLSGLGVFRSEYSEPARQNQPDYVEPTLDPVRPSFGPVGDPSAATPQFDIFMKLDLTPSSSSIGPYRAIISGAVSAPKDKGFHDLQLTAVLMNASNDAVIGSITLAQNASVAAGSSLEIYEIKGCTEANLKLVVYAEWIPDGANEAAGTYFTVFPG